jgi:hypothetical protein
LPPHRLVRFRLWRRWAKFATGFALSVSDTLKIWCTYVWDLHLIDPFGRITTILSGTVYVTNDVTREQVGYMANYVYVKKAGDVMSGALILSADPTRLLQARSHSQRQIRRY